MLLSESVVFCCGCVCVNVSYSAPSPINCYFFSAMLYTFLLDVPVNEMCL